MMGHPLLTRSVYGWLFLLLPALATAHGGEVHTSTGAWQQWNWHPNVIIPLLVGIGFYAFGLFRLWHRAGVGRGMSRARAAAYGAGIFALIVALVSPLEAAAGRLFSLHMTQHLLLILVAPPLLVIGNPDIALLWALPAKWRAGWGRFEQRMGNSVTRGKGPLVVVLLATGVLWIWHVPELYDLAVRDEVVHWTEHATFLVTSLLFWITVLRLRVQDHADNGMRILYVFGMTVQGSLLGALITFASQPLYRSYAGGTAALEPLVDQQLAGLIMWVPPAALYIAVVAYLFVNWLRAVERRNAPPAQRARISKESSTATSPAGDGST